MTSEIEQRLQKAGLMRGGSAERSVQQRLNLTTKKVAKTTKNTVKKATR